MLRQQPRIVLVTRETRMENLLERWATRGRALFNFKQAKVAANARAGNMAAAMALQSSTEDDDFKELESEDGTYHRAVQQLKQDLDFGMPVQEIDRRYLPNFDFDLATVVVVVGQDGLVANTAKYVGSVPIVGVNPDPSRFDGALLPYHVAQARGAVANLLSNNAIIKEVTLAKVMLHDGQSLLAFNDFFIGANSHVSARYELSINQQSESQSSSGLLVSTGAGSTGWMSSVFHMAAGVARYLGAESPSQDLMAMEWDSPWLAWAVREPFLSQRSGVGMVAGRLNAGEELVITSRMDTGGVIFSDGIQADFLDFNAGSIARISQADHSARLVVPSHRRPPTRPHATSS